LQQRCERSRGTTRPDAFPEDFAVFARFNRKLRAIPERHPAPDPLPLTAVEEITSKLDTGRRAPADPTLATPAAERHDVNHCAGQNGTRSPTPRFPSAD
jgi:hypothetical protein